MTQEERQGLLDLLNDESRWCRDFEARDSNGDPTCFDSDDAVSWDLTGAICRLCGWDRALALFGQFARHINGRRTSVLLSRDNGVGAMGELQVFNDHPETTFDDIRRQIDSMPIWSPGGRRSNDDSQPTEIG
ncbi:MAG TPA: hypothetical protein P5081_15915 [Phycisphaerae bacterium]|nr:hypothetical protein [Phycisphaerae bacterium]HRW54358.1 hypothetical protein [Phycisphaerae bacterium]